MEVVAGILLLGFVLALVGLATLENSYLKSVINKRDERISELENKLMSRSYGEYAAFEPSFYSERDPDIPTQETHYITDPTGIIVTEVDDVDG